MIVARDTIRDRHMRRIIETLGHNRGGTLHVSPATHRRLAVIVAENATYLHGALIVVDRGLPDGIAIHRYPGEEIGQTILLD